MTFTSTLCANSHLLHPLGQRALSVPSPRSCPSLLCPVMCAPLTPRPEHIAESKPHGQVLSHPLDIERKPLPSTALPSSPLSRTANVPSTGDPSGAEVTPGRDLAQGGVSACDPPPFLTWVLVPSPPRARDHPWLLSEQRPNRPAERTHKPQISEDQPQSHPPPPWSTPSLGHGPPHSTRLFSPTPSSSEWSLSPREDAAAGLPEQWALLAATRCRGPLGPEPEPQAKMTLRVNPALWEVPPRSVAAPPTGIMELTCGLGGPEAGGERGAELRSRGQRMPSQYWAAMGQAAGSGQLCLQGR